MTNDDTSKASDDEKNKKVTQRRTISPYDLSSNDNPGSVISQPLLKGPNYDEWASSLRLALAARKKFGFVDGSIPQPASDSGDLEDWWTNNALVVSWIKLTIDSTIRSNLSHRDVASDLWNHIQKRFSVKNGSKIQRIKTEIATARQGGQQIEAYFGHLNKLWITLTDYRPPKMCKCASCTCNLNLELEKERDEDRVHELLRGVDEVYVPLQYALLSRVPFPSLDDVYNALTQEEDSRLASLSFKEHIDGASFAMQTQQPRRVRDERDKNVTCSGCGRNGHGIDQCFQQIGYPPWWGDRPKNRGIVAAGSGSTNSKGRGKEVAHVNVVGTVRTGSYGGGFSGFSEVDRTGFSGLNETQWKTLVKMLDERKPSSSDRLTGPHHEDPDWSG